ncbi:SapC family protein [Persephonella sp.]
MAEGTEKPLYKEIEIINSDTHKDLKISTLKDFSRFKKLNSCIVLGGEFPEVSKFYPIVFIQTGGEEITPVVVLGFDENFFIDDKGNWTEGHYIPAFVRRYPFILVEEKGEKDGERKLFVAVDKSYEGYNDENGERLFNEDGSNSEYLNRMMDFLRAYDVDYHLTMNFAKKLKDLDLLQTIEATIKTPDNRTFVMKNLFAVDEQKLRNLKDEDVLDLFRSGFLGWIYAHLISLNNFARIVR